MNRLATSLSLCLTLALALPAASRADIDFKSGVWGHLSQHIGTYNFDAVLADPGVSARLSAILGTNLARLHERLEVHGPISFDGVCLGLAGNMPRRGGTDRAYLNVCPSGDVDIVLASEDSVEIYTRFEDYAHLDWRLRAWVHEFQTDGSDLATLPPGAALITVD